MKNILKDRVQKVKKSNLSTRHQVEAVELWDFIGKESDIKILLRLAKINLNIFLKAKNHLQAMYKDGMKVRNKFSYFLWLYKFYNKNGSNNTNSKKSI